MTDILVKKVTGVVSAAVSEAFGGAANATNLMNTLQGNISDRTAEASRYKGECGTLQEVKTSLTKTNGMLEVELNEKRSNEITYTKEIAELKGELKIERAKYAEAHDKLTKLTADHDNSEKNHKTYVDEQTAKFHELKNNLDEEKAAHIYFREQMELEKNKNTRLQQDLEDTKLQSKTMIDELKQQRNERDLEHKKSALDAGTERTHTEMKHKEELQSRDVELTGLRAELKASCVQEAETKEAKLKLQTTLDQLKEKYDELDKQLKKSVLDAESYKNRAEIELRAVNIKLEHTNTELAEVNKQLTEMKVDKKQVEEELVDAEEELKSEKESSAELQNKFRKLRAECLEMTINISSFEAQEKIDKERISSLEADVHCAEEKEKRLKDELQRAKEEIDKTKLDAEAKSKEVQELKTAVGKLEGSLEVKQHELDIELTKLKEANENNVKLEREHHEKTRKISELDKKLSKAKEGAVQAFDADGQAYELSKKLYKTVIHKVISEKTGSIALTEVDRGFLCSALEHYATIVTETTVPVPSKDDPQECAKKARDVLERVKRIRGSDGRIDIQLK